MLPLASSSRRPGIRIPRANDGSIGSGLASFLAPPLYYNSNDASNRRGREARVLLVTDKNGNRINLPRSPSTFTPIKDEKPPPTTEYTPPMSPYFHSRMVSSPSPTLTSVTSASETAETSMASPYCMSPSPSTPYHCYQVSSYSGRDSSETASLCATPRYAGQPMRSPAGGFSTPTRRSPTKKGLSSLGTPNNNHSEDSSRKQKVKTELCVHHESGKNCPFGINCTYAHGEEELQMTKLMDLHRAGLIEDINTYRSKPCLTWVTTGSCPFGKRCACIHDPRVTGCNPSWLPHTETQGNSMSTDINVEGMYQKRLHAILYGNPFGDQFSFTLDDWADLYKLICNVTSNIRRRRSSNLTELQKLSIVLQMRGGPGWMYKYRPQHIIYDTLCMEVQKQAFRIDKTGEPIPIPVEFFNPRNPKHILVREIAFGPDSDPAVRPVSLWFNIPETSVAECTPQQAKRFRWKKKPKGDHDQQQAYNKGSMFELQDNFVMIRPEDRDAFEFATEILEHRYVSLKADGLPNMRDRSAAMREADEEKQRLQAVFKAHRRHWVEWAWPMNRGRHQTINEETPVPPVETHYNPMMDSDPSDELQVNMRDSVQGHFVKRIWESFVWNTSKAGEGCVQQYPYRRRLPIFARLGYGMLICENRALPHIHGKVKPQEKPILNHTIDQSERCWKALMLKHDDDCLDEANNEWEIVREHFQRARSKKVLSIIQQ